MVPLASTVNELPFFRIVVRKPEGSGLKAVSVLEALGVIEISLTVKVCVCPFERLVRVSDAPLSNFVARLSG